MQPALPGEIQPGREHLPMQLHAHLVGAIQAMEHAGRTLYDCAQEVPWACVLDMARQVWDTSRHVETFVKLVQHEGDRGNTWSVTTVLPAALHVDAGHGWAAAAWVPLRHTAQHMGDAVLAGAVDYLLADALAHVHRRRYWLRTLPDVACLHQAFAWYREADGRLMEALPTACGERGKQRHAAV